MTVTSLEKKITEGDMQVLTVGDLKKFIRNIPDDTVLALQPSYDVPRLISGVVYGSAFANNITIETRKLRLIPHKKSTTKVSVLTFLEEATDALDYSSASDGQWLWKTTKAAKTYRVALFTLRGKESYPSRFITYITNLAKKKK